MSREEMDALRRMLERERRARHSAEQLLEEKSRELGDSNERLRLATLGMGRIGEDLSEVQDLNLLLDRTLTEARALTCAEAGSILTREVTGHGPELMFAYSQNDHIEQGRSDVLPRVGASPRLPIGMQSIAGAVAMTGIAINVADAYALPAGVPYRFNAQFDEITGYRTRAMLTVPLRALGGEVMGVLQLINPLQGRRHPSSVFDAQDETIIRHFAGIASVAMERARTTRSIITRMIRSVELRDPYETARHAGGVADLSVDLWRAWAEANNVHPREIDRGADRLRLSAMLHDVGKIGVSDSILQKPGRLTPAEMQAVRQHVLIGARLFDDVQFEFDRHARDVALYHHARWDGTGYPTMQELAKLREEAPTAAGPVIEPRGEQIPLFARIVAIADVYDALVSERSYKKAWSTEDALAAIQAEAGRHFDPGLAALFPAVVRRRMAQANSDAA